MFLNECVIYVYLSSFLFSLFFLVVIDSVGPVISFLVFCGCFHECFLKILTLFTVNMYHFQKAGHYIFKVYTYCKQAHSPSTFIKITCSLGIVIKIQVCCVRSYLPNLTVHQRYHFTIDINKSLIFFVQIYIQHTNLCI